MTKGVLGKDYVVLQSRGEREYQNGAVVESDEFMHLSVDVGQSTVCGKAPSKFLLTYDDVNITYLDCIKILKRKAGKAK